MMKIYVIEWYEGHRYHQEYYTNLMRAAVRAQMLIDDVPDSDVNIETVTVDCDGAPDLKRMLQATNT